MIFKPMLASEADLTKLQFPLYASPKLDGIRASVVGGKLLTRSLKEVPNRHIFNTLSDRRFDGLDGELIVGDKCASDVYRNTVSQVMSRDGEPLADYWVFDLHDVPSGFEGRYIELRSQVPGLQVSGVRIQLLPQYLIHSPDELLGYETKLVSQGYEGVILRGMHSPYKYGRSTAKEGYLLKLKRFLDSEAEVIEVIEEMHNGNEATTNELGRTKRSSHQAGKTGKGRAGALLVRDLKTAIEFQIGTGMNDADKDWWWKHGKPGALVKYKYFPVGVKDKPRHPVYLGIRDARDL